ncbi:hypothetical protein A1O1_05707 [Capronia coronata CBS 617.96]|uniref:Acyltransferase 3 domain-containing protein n=1 Tax=Capronia coronata CBS 617.96 TaxID=1182541 RepID=W9XYR8_9EURO|nr:uncharacterized protein A1O1_05707 [Capronia coronata CBS 617.96]EXJ85343.1 hypothetical protein A1O1_05707 [Capronia coronata CBS 617.96]
MEQAVPLLDETSSRGNNGDPPTESVTPAASKWATRWKQVRDWLIHILLPVYALRHCKRREETSLRPTAYIDALRGWAAMFVYLFHAWGMTQTIHYRFFQLPFIRILFFSGGGMVAIFFIISGYVLSYSMLKMMRNHEAERLLNSLASSIFRRYLRLYGSMGIASFVAFWEVRLQWWIPPQVDRKPSFLAQLWDWILDLARASNPFADISGYASPPGVLRTRYLPQMWTIPIEYRGSIVLFVFCAAACKLSTRGRRIFLWLVVMVAYCWRVVYISEFLVGMFIADLSLSRHPERLGGHIPMQQQVTVVGVGETDEKSTTEKGHGLSIAWRVWYVVLLLVGLFLIGQELNLDQMALLYFPWPLLHRMIPFWYGDASYTFWLSIGASLIVFSIDSYPTLQRPFRWRLSQYLGEISFGIYAMHKPVFHFLLERVLDPWRARHLGESLPAYLPGAILTTIAVLWVADYFTRLDHRVIRFGRWLQTKTFTKWA